jgi:hypothetical protein
MRLAVPVGEAGKARGQITQFRANETVIMTAAIVDASGGLIARFIECGIRRDGSTHHVGELVMDPIGRLARWGDTGGVAS